MTKFVPIVGPNVRRLRVTTMSIHPPPPRTWALFLTGGEGTRLQRVNLTTLFSKCAAALLSGGTRAANVSPCGKLQTLLLQCVLDRREADVATNLDLMNLAAEPSHATAARRLILVLTTRSEKGRLSTCQV